MFEIVDTQLMQILSFFDRFISHQEDQDTLDRFHLHLFPDVGKPKNERRFLRGVREKLWETLDNLNTSFPTKVRVLF